MIPSRASERRVWSESLSNTGKINRRERYCSTSGQNNCLLPLHLLWLLHYWHLIRQGSWTVQFYLALNHLTRFLLLLTIPRIPSHFLGCVWNKDAVLLVTETKSPRRRREQEVIQLYCSSAVWSDLGCTAAQTSLCIYYSRWHLAFCLKQQSQILIGPLDCEWLRFNVKNIQVQ